MTSPTAAPCNACNALAGEMCSPDCVGLADATDRLNGRLIPDAVPPVCAYCGNAVRVVFGKRGESFRHIASRRARCADGDSSAWPARP